MSLRIFTVISTSPNTTLNRTTIYHIFSFWLPKHICPLWHFHNTEAHRQNHKFGLQNAHKTLKHATNAMFSIKHHNLWSKRKSMGENAPRKKKKIHIYIFHIQSNRSWRLYYRSSSTSHWMFSLAMHWWKFLLASLFHHSGLHERHVLIRPVIIHIPPPRREELLDSVQ